jgi:hypothetical protein
METWFGVVKKRCDKIFPCESPPALNAAECVGVVDPSWSSSTAPLPETVQPVTLGVL